jgi:hypothetical protein
MEFLNKVAAEAAEEKYRYLEDVVDDGEKSPAPDFNIGDFVEVSFIAEVSNWNPDTNEYEVILPYNFLQGRYNHAYFPRDSVESYVEPYEEGAVYRDPATGEYYLRMNDSWRAFGSEIPFDDVVFGWSQPEKVLDANGEPV